MEMAEVPWIFLSHSGKQKEFARRLYQELLQVGHYPFFDQDADALPKGHHFPTRIVDACRSCKMGVVVLSHDYLQSLWPMLELEQLTFHNPNSILIYPLFYGLHPADLSDHDNLRRWETRWDSRASSWPNRILQLSNSQISIDMSSWPEAVQMLKSQNGEVLQPHMEEHAYIQSIVLNICRTLPPPQHYRLGGQFKGMDRLQQNIEVLLRQQDIQDNGVIALGVYGVGGSGKTTLCKSMTNLCNKDFPGRSCWLEFPSDQNNEKKLVKVIKKVLPILTGVNNEALHKICSIEEAMGHLEEGLKRHKVFLAIDNVWDWNLDNARQIVREMKYISGSMVMVASRSMQALQRLLLKTVHVPSITEEEAVDALLYYSHASSFPHGVSGEDLRSLVKSCFYEQQCHPLLLKAVGDRLKQVGGHMNHGKDWKDFISHLQAFRTTDGDMVEESVLKVLDESFAAISTELQSIFIDAVTCVPRHSTKQCKWLSMLHDQGCTLEMMKYKLVQLEYHGLLEMNESMETYTVHDLYKAVARRHITRDAPCNYFFDGDLSQCQQKNLKYAVGRKLWPVDYINGMGTRNLKLVNCFPELKILHVYYAHKVQWLSVQGMVSLQCLELQDCLGLKEIEGWKGAPNLVSIRLDGCSNLEKVGDIGDLHKLEELSMEGCLYLQTFPDVSLSRLRTLNLRKCVRLVSLEGNECALLNLEELDLTSCDNLRKVPDLKNLATLKFVRGIPSQGCPQLGVSSLISLEVYNGWFSLRCSLDVRAVTVAELLIGRSRLHQLQLIQTRGQPPVSAFVSLRELVLDSEVWDDIIVSLDVSGLVNLQKFSLGSFTSLEDIVGLASCKSLQMMALQRGKSLRSLPRDLPASLVDLRLGRCTALTNVSSLTSLASLQNLYLSGSSSLQDVLSFTSLASLQTLYLTNCFSLQDLPDLSHINTNLYIYGLGSCPADPAWLRPPLWVRSSSKPVIYHRTQHLPKTLCSKELVPARRLNIHYDNLVPVGRLDIHYDKMMGYI